ncbi:hypothetical protein [Spongiibacter sp. IMCC21906]
MSLFIGSLAVEESGVNRVLTSVWALLSVHCYSAYWDT